MEEPSVTEPGWMPFTSLVSDSAESSESGLHTASVVWQSKAYSENQRRWPGSLWREFRLLLHSGFWFIELFLLPLGEHWQLFHN